MRYKALWSVVTALSITVAAPLSVLANQEQDLIGAAYQGQLHVVKRLIDGGVNIEARDENGYTALLWAAYNGNAALLNYLVASGAYIDAVSNDGYTALMLASSLGRTGTVKLLLSKGANRDLVSHDGYTAMDFYSGAASPEQAETIFYAGVSARDNAIDRQINSTLSRQLPNEVTDSSPEAHDYSFIITRGRAILSDPDFLHLVKDVDPAIGENRKYYIGESVSAAGMSSFSMPFVLFIGGLALAMIHMIGGYSAPQTLVSRDNGTTLSNGTVSDFNNSNNLVKAIQFGLIGLGASAGTYLVTKQWKHRFSFKEARIAAEKYNSVHSDQIPIVVIKP